MKKVHKYKHIYFIKSTPVTWMCNNRQTHDILGEVYWYDSWNQYVFEPTGAQQTLHSASCLRDIADFLERLNKGWIDD